MNVKTLVKNKRPQIIASLSTLIPFALAMLGFVFSLLPVIACAQAVIDGYNPNADGQIKAFVVQPDGKAIVLGAFGNIGGAPRSKIARLNADGTADADFNPGSSFNGSAEAVVRQPDGKLIVGGVFTAYNGAPVTNLARLNADGSLDTSFATGTGPNLTVRAITLVAGGKIIIGGDFASVNGSPRTRVARLNPNGSVDTNFDPATGPNGAVLSIGLTNEGQMVIGGTFTKIGSVTSNNIARLSSDGSFDPMFNPGGVGANEFVTSVKVLDDGKVLVGGQFSAFNGVNRGRIVRLNRDGSLDASFNSGGSGASNTIRTIAVQPDGRILVGGAFASFNGVTRLAIARLTADGANDPTFDLFPGLDQSADAIAVESNGNVLAGGSFQSVNGVTRRRIARFDSGGKLDTTFLPTQGANGAVYGLGAKGDGKVVVVGAFTSINGASRNGIARLNSDATIDPTFNPGPGADGVIFASTLQPDGKVLIGGSFTTVRGVVRNRIARLNADATLDTSFNAGTFESNSVVVSIARQADGKIVIAGGFSSVNGAPANQIARLNADGSLDTSFNIGLGPNRGFARALAILPNGQILVGGDFTALGGTAQGHIARLNADGSVDTSFNAGSGANGAVVSLLRQPDGKLVIGGGFTEFNGAVTPGLVRLNADGSRDQTFNSKADLNEGVTALAMYADGAIGVAGLVGVPNQAAQKRLVKLGRTGDLLSSVASGGVINALLIESDGKVLVGGDFSTMNGQPRERLARLSTSSGAVFDWALSNVNAGVQWTQAGGAPAYVEADFAYSTDAVNWSPLGSGNQISNGWEIRGLALPIAQRFWVRARARSLSGIYASSSGLTEQIKQFYIEPPPVDPVANDLSGDGKADIVLQNSDGRIHAFLMDGVNQTGNAALYPAGSGWRVTHSGDFNDDGKADLVLAHTDGRVMLTLMSGLIPAVSAQLFDAGSGWRVTHVDTFGGNGKSSLVLAHQDGRIAVQIMNGIDIVGRAELAPAGSPLSVVKTADLNGDGRADLILRNTLDGSTIGWIMNGVSILSSAQIIAPGSNWSVSHVGDLNGDGKSDLVLFDSLDQGIAVYLMNGFAILDSALLIEGNRGWRVTHVGDVNGDGKADLFLKHEEGRTRSLMMSGLNVINKAEFGPGNNWTVSQLADFNGDGRMDAVFQSDTGALQVWLLNGAAVIGSAMLPVPGTGWTPVPAQ
jgi:uncharacterized delta-60 repeat protein